MKKIEMFSIFLFCTIGIFAQTIDADKLDSSFHLLIKNEKFNGSIEVSHNQKTIYSNSIGFADVDNSVKVVQPSFISTRLLEKRAK